jgi:hypothetical protein
MVSSQVDVMRARLFYIMLAVFVAGCSVTEPQQAPGAWDVTITGRGAFPDLRGTAGIASQFGSTTAAVRVEGAPNAVFTWRLYRGTCLAPGSGIGAPDRYPELRPGATGIAEVQTNINQMLDRDGEFALIVRATDNEIAGCGDLRRFQA